MQEKPPGHFKVLGLRVLAGMLNRRDQGGADLRKRILNPLVKEGLLQRAYPNPNDPRQAYLALPPAGKGRAEPTYQNQP